MGVKIGIVVFDGIIPFHLSVPCAVFEKAVTSGGDALCSLTICATQPGTLNTNAGFAIVVENGLDALGDMDMVIVPSWDTPQHIPEPELVAALQRAHTAGALVVGLCMGAFVVAAAGLLAGRQATTHWRWAADFQRRYPNVRVDHDVLYIDEGDVITSAGTAASIDCCLHVVRRLWGRRLPLPWRDSWWCRRIGRAVRRSTQSIRYRIPARGIVFLALLSGPVKICNYP